MEIAAGHLAEVQSALRTLVTEDLVDLQRSLDEADVPWTPGRTPRGA